MRLCGLVAILAAVAAAQAPPKSAIRLFDGKTLNGWVADEHYKVVDGAIEVNGFAPHPKCRMATKETFGDVLLHVEFWLPLMADKTGQARANSGVFLQGRYELQILDTLGHPPEIDGAGSIYKVAAPRVNANLPPGQWQTYDILYRGAKFKGDQVVAKPHITVTQNGMKIHDNLELAAFATPNNVETEYARTGPIMLQNHRCPVRFRNLWVVRDPKP